MLLLGIDLGTSSVKVSVVDADTQQLLASATWPETEAPIYSPAPGWAEQNPENWWDYVQTAILKCHAAGQYDPRHIAAIGIAYQMHGLVLTNPAGQSIRNSIIWCDSRAVNIGDKAYQELGESYCQNHLLNSPGNFTASKLYRTMNGKNRSKPWNLLHIQSIIIQNRSGNCVLLKIPHNSF